jgi:glycosyltransferase involved in cell wall biosynthesis
MAKTIMIVAGAAFSLLRFRAHLIRRLVEGGHRVVACAPDYDPESLAQLKALGAEPLPLVMDRASLSPGGLVREILQLRKLIKEVDPDLVFSYFIRPVIVTTLAARLSGPRKVAASIEGLGYFFSPGGGLSGRKRLVRSGLLGGLRLALRSSDKTLFCNEDDATLLLGAKAQDRGRYVQCVGGVGVDLDEYPQQPVPAGPAQFLFLGRLVRHKGLYQFAEAARIVKARAPEARFRVVGGLDPSPAGVPEADVRAWQAEGLIDWTGHVSDVRAEVAAATVFVLPSHGEGASRSMMEAMATGRPVVTTNTPGNRSMTVDGLNGYVVPFGDAPALAEALMRFVDNPGLAAEMGNASRKLADRYDIHAVTEETARELETLIQPK